MERNEWALLQKTALFQGMEQEEIESLLAGVESLRRSYRKGEVIYEPRTFFRSLGILLSGSVAVSKGDFPVSKLKAGDLFGAAALYNEQPDYVTTLTARSACKVLLLREEQVELLLTRSHPLRRNYIRYLSERIRFLSAKMEALAGPTAESRLLCYLEQHGSGGEVRLDCSLTELAKRLGMGRASLYRALDSLEEQRMLMRDGKTILLLQRKDEES